MAEVVNVLTCPTCGGPLELSPGATRMQCPHCGNEVVISQAATGPTCPKCGRPDQIQKVSGLYEANTKEWMERHGTGDDAYTELHQARTLLGEKLAPPTEPGYPSNPLFLYGLGGVILFIFVSTFCPLPIVLFLSLAGIVQALNPSGAILFATGIVCIGIGTLFVIGAVVWAGPAVKRHFGRVMASYNQSKAQIDNEERPRWQRAMDRWNQLYYCARDETIFIPGENKAISTDKMKDYLFESN